VDSKKLISKTHTNLEEDRKRLTDLYEKVKELAENTSDILGLAAVSEHLVKITDSLTKQNAQLLDLAKMKQKKKLLAREHHHLLHLDCQKTTWMNVSQR